MSDPRPEDLGKEFHCMVGFTNLKRHWFIEYNNSNNTIMYPITII